jgi:hypothetical protein
MKQLNVFGTRPTVGLEGVEDLDLVLVLLRLGLPRQILVFSLEFDRVFSFIARMKQLNVFGTRPTDHELCGRM